MSLDKNYETHLTLRVSGSNILSRVAAWAESQQLKWTHIVLDSGDTPSQPMITFWGKGDISSQMARAQRLALDVVSMGASVVRVKIETPADSASMTADAITKDGYFENHIKLLLPGDWEQNSLSCMVIPHGARLSRNVRRVRTDGREERFVTQRIYNTDHNSPQCRLDHLVADLRRSQYAIIEIEQEYVVFDSHLALDAGWL